jgi:hypothetical protein
MQPAEAAGRGSSVARIIIKMILHPLIKLIIVVWRLWRRHPLPALIVLMMLIGSYIALTSGTVTLPWQASAASSPPTGARTIVESYLVGQQQFNAAMMWEAMSDELKAQMRQNGTTFETFQQQVQQRRDSGLQFTTFQYVGGTGLDAGHSVHLYVVTASDGRQSRRLPFTFTLNQVHKIVNIE